MARQTVRYNLGTLDAANEYTVMQFSWDFRNAVFTFIAASSAACTIKFYGSNSETAPTLASAASASNIYSPTEVIDLDDHSAIDWSTWVVYAGSSDWIHRYEINENLNRWLWVIMTARAAWSVTVSLELSDNQ